MDPFAGEIRMMANNYAPQNWASCNGATQYIQQNQLLYVVIGTIYGGDGKTTYKLPNLQGRTPMGLGQGPGLSTYTIGESDGTDTVTLGYGQMPTHNHTVNAFAAPGDKAPGNTTLLARGYAAGAPSLATKNRKLYDTELANPQYLDNRTIGGSCSSGPHENRQPYLVMNYYICTYGDYPVRSN